MFVKLLDYLQKDRVVQMASEMIKLESYAGVPLQETPVARYIKGVFDDYDIPCYLKEVEDGRCNVIATLDSGQPGKTLLFNGHMDTVEPNDMKDAFNPQIINGMLYGRGASDMKGPLATMIEAIIILKESKVLKKGKVIFSGVLDEEHNSIGTIDLIESGLDVDAAIVGEPTSLEIHTAHRGLEWYKFHFTGKTVHGGAQREGINAIAKAVDFINAMEAELIPAVMAKTHTLLKEATVNYGVIHGGTQLSTVAGTCDLYVDRRYLPFETYEEVTEEFQSLIDKLAAKDPKFKCEMTVTEESRMKRGYVHRPMEISVNHEFVAMCKHAEETVLEKEPTLSFFPAWTDGGLLNGYAKIPTIVMGPGIIECCHSSDEHIPVEHLVKAPLIYALIAVQFCES